jgi:hypothetical protein
MNRGNVDICRLRLWTNRFKEYPRASHVAFGRIRQDEHVGASGEISLGDLRRRHTAKRSVFSVEDLQATHPSASSPVKMIDFLLVGHIEPVVYLDTLVRTGVFSNRPPQSIAQLSEQQYGKLKLDIQLGFKL